MRMTKAEKRGTWVLWMTAIVLAGMIFCRLTMVFGLPGGEVADWPFFKQDQPLQMGSQWK
jgi:hypothetical protein